MIAPKDQIGLLGGGQLGMFFTQAAQRMGYRVIVWDPDPNAPAAAVADRFICAPFDDAALPSFLSDVKGVTYEWENIPASLVETIEKEVITRPGSRVLRLLQNRIDQKQFFHQQGVPVAPFRPLFEPKALLQSAEELGLPCIVKTATAGYDGQGQWRLEQASDIVTLQQQFRGHPYPTGWIIEKQVDYLKELSTIVVYAEPSKVEAYPVAENLHEQGILRTSLVPADLDTGTAHRATSLATRAVATLSEPGVFCVEMFLMKTGEILVNEIAPRPHNSGHYTMDVCSVSQFEQQVRILCGLPILTPTLHSRSLLINILGDEIERLQSQESTAKLQTIPVRFYHYNKRVVKKGRKMGHLLLVHSDRNALTQQAKTVFALLQ